MEKTWVDRRKFFPQEKKPRWQGGMIETGHCPPPPNPGNPCVVFLVLLIRGSIFISAEVLGNRRQRRNKSSSLLDFLRGVRPAKNFLRWKLFSIFQQKIVWLKLSHLCRVCKVSKAEEEASIAVGDVGGKGKSENLLGKFIFLPHILFALSRAFSDRCGPPILFHVLEKFSVNLFQTTSDPRAGLGKKICPIFTRKTRTRFGKFLNGRL